MTKSELAALQSAAQQWVHLSLPLSKAARVGGLGSRTAQPSRCQRQRRSGGQRGAAAPQNLSPLTEAAQAREAELVYPTATQRDKTLPPPLQKYTWDTKGCGTSSCPSWSALLSPTCCHPHLRAAGRQWIAIPQSWHAALQGRRGRANPHLTTCNAKDMKGCFSICLFLYIYFSNFASPLLFPQQTKSGVEQAWVILIPFYFISLWRFSVCF